MNEQEILDSAPLMQILPGDEGEKIGLVCVSNSCTWWTNSPKHCKQSGKRLQCAECYGNVRETPLELLLTSTKEQNPDHYDAFLASFSENRR